MDHAHADGVAGTTTLKVQVLARYSRKGASSRLRTLQYAPFLAKEGISLECQAFLDDNYIERLYAGSRSLKSLFPAYLGRIRSLLARSSADLLWIEKEALPWTPWLLEQALLPRKLKIISDYDDAVFHTYDQHSSSLVRMFLGSKIDSVMSSSTVVFAGNNYLAARARAAGGKNVEIVPTVVDTDLYDFHQPERRERMPVIGWIGTPVTWAEYMTSMVPIITSVPGYQGQKIRAVGASTHTESHPLVESIEWSEATEVSEIRKMDIGIMPLSNTPWSKGKCGYKLLQYMACSLPVVASPVGVNCEIIEHGVNGFLAERASDWRDALGRLLSDAALRARMGEAGRKKVQSKYSIETWAPRIAAIMKDTALCADR